MQQEEKNTSNQEVVKYIFETAFLISLIIRGKVLLRKSKGWTEKDLYHLTTPKGKDTARSTERRRGGKDFKCYRKSETQGDTNDHLFCGIASE